MLRKLILPVLLVCLFLPTLGQKLGDQSSAGFGNSRTYANNDILGLRPPLRLRMTLGLGNAWGVTDATSLAVFEDKFLVGQKGSPVKYSLFSFAGIGEPSPNPGLSFAWSQTVPGTGESFRFIPAVRNSLVILGGESLTSVEAVNIADGSVIWSDEVGNTNGRFPAVTDNLVVYAGRDKIVARTLAGEPFWQQAVTTAAAALAVRDDSLYFLGQDRALWAINLGTTPVSEKWPAIPDVAADGASLIATDHLLFVNDPVGGTVTAFDAKTGQPAWDNPVVLPGTFATTPGLALGSGRLFVFRSKADAGTAAVSAYDANTGKELWSITENQGEGLSYGFFADNVVYYYHSRLGPTGTGGLGGQIRARDAVTGALLWSIQKDDVRGLTAAGRKSGRTVSLFGDASSGELFVLLDHAIEVYVALNEIFMAHLANGLGQTTLIMLSNTGSDQCEAIVLFYDDEGNLVPVPLRTLGAKFEANVMIPPNSSVGIQTVDEGGALISGWVRVVSEVPVRGTTAFQYNQQQEIIREAGVADSLPIGSANIFVSAGGGFNAGVAMANPTEQDAQVTLRLLDGSGQELASKTFDLSSGAHLARFINELFEDEIGTAFEGSLQIDSNVPVVITAIRTKDGLQISSYPVGQAVR